MNRKKIVEICFIAIWIILNATIINCLWTVNINDLEFTAYINLAISRIIIMPGFILLSLASLFFKIKDFESVRLKLFWIAYFAHFLYSLWAINATPANTNVNTLILLNDLRYFIIPGMIILCIISLCQKNTEVSTS